MGEVHDPRAKKVSDKKSILGAIAEYLQSKGYNATVQELVSANIPNTVATGRANGFLRVYFNRYGDKMPNSNQIHLDPITCKEVHEKFLEVGHHNCFTRTLCYYTYVL